MRTFEDPIEDLNIHLQRSLKNLQGSSKVLPSTMYFKDLQNVFQDVQGSTRIFKVLVKIFKVKASWESLLQSCGSWIQASLRRALFEKI